MGRGQNINIHRITGVGRSWFQPSWMTVRGSRPQWRESLQMRWKQREDQNQKWGLEMGLNGCNLRIKLERMRSCCFPWVPEMESIPAEMLWRLLKWQEDSGYDTNSVVKQQQVWEHWLQFWKFYCGLNAIKQHHLLQRNHSWKEGSVAAANFIGVSYFVLFCLFILRESERERVCALKWGRGRERGRERILSRLHIEPDAGLKSMDCDIMIWAKTKCQMLNQLSHPGAPTGVLF